MLTDDEKKMIEKEVAKFPVKSAACIDVLKLIQDKRRWISDEILTEVAEILDMSAAELDNVTTFYNLIFRKPVGKHVILLCDSISCWVMGYSDILLLLNKKLGISYGETTEDGLFTLLPIQCLGSCDHAPTMMIDDKLYRNLTEEKIDQILAQYQ